MANLVACINHIKRSSIVGKNHTIKISLDDLMVSLQNWLTKEENANVFSVKHKTADTISKCDYLLIKYSEDTGTAHFSTWSGDVMYYSDGIVTGPYKPIYIEFLEFLDD